MLTRENVFTHVQEKYDTLPDYPFKKFPNYAALRHKSNGKWYGLVMDVTLKQLGLDGEEEVDILNLKCPPDVSGSLRDRRSILPAYHMDKEHWITLILKRINLNTEEFYNLIEQSFHLTKDS